MPTSFQVTLVSLPGRKVPVHMRLKRVLKGFLRHYGFRCTDIRKAGRVERGPGTGKTKCPRIPRPEPRVPSSDYLPGFVPLD